MLQAESDVPAFHYGSHYSCCGCSAVLPHPPGALHPRLNRNLQVLPWPVLLISNDIPHLNSVANLLVRSDKFSHVCLTMQTVVAI